MFVVTLKNSLVSISNVISFFRYIPFIKFFQMFHFISCFEIFYFISFFEVFQSIKLKQFYIITDKTTSIYVEHVLFPPNKIAALVSHAHSFNMSVFHHHRSRSLLFTSSSIRCLLLIKHAFYLDLLKHIWCRFSMAAGRCMKWFIHYFQQWKHESLAIAPPPGLHYFLPT